jgi:hypothetical protein
MYDTFEQPVTKLPPVQLKVYLAIKENQPVTIQELCQLVNKPAKNMSSSLSSLQLKKLVKLEDHVYRTTDLKFFDVKKCNQPKEVATRVDDVADQIEWNRQVLQQKALKEARMRINL